LDGEEQRRYERALEQESNKEVREMAITWEEALAEREARGEARGREEGRTEGRTEGRIEAMQDALLLALDRRFGSTPSEVQERIRSIEDPIVLNALLGQALTADSLSALDLG
jgi:predicted transposase YdaD